MGEIRICGDCIKRFIKGETLSLGEQCYNCGNSYNGDELNDIGDKEFSEEEKNEKKAFFN